MREHRRSGALRDEDDLPGLLAPSLPGEQHPRRQRRRGLRMERAQVAVGREARALRRRRLRRLGSHLGSGRRRGGAVVHLVPLRLGGGREVGTPCGGQLASEGQGRGVHPGAAALSRRGRRRLMRSRWGGVGRCERRKGGRDCVHQCSVGSVGARAEVDVRTRGGLRHTLRPRRDLLLPLLLHDMLRRLQRPGMSVMLAAAARLR
mmetsp:Transcript_55312/g.160260  ORF Transcript_55312/g.160260 Transcript_55312/m.160260 type:complete len:205 (-) Transcript_55312:1013-1627(-)